MSVIIDKDGNTFWQEDINEPVIISYNELVVQFIREKYSLDEELAIQRQRDVKIVEFSEYNNYCEQCKIKAKEIINELETQVNNMS